MTILTKESADDTLSLSKHDDLQKAVSLLHKARIIHLSAISYSLLLGQTFQLNMNRLGRLVNICPVEGEELFLDRGHQHLKFFMLINHINKNDKPCLLIENKYFHFLDLLQ